MNYNVINFLRTKRSNSHNLSGNSHHACALVPNHLKGTSAKVGYLW